MKFESFNLDEHILQGVQNAGYKVATPIQEAVILPALRGRDVIGTAQTGTGKTAAFVLPILQRLLDHPGTGRTRVLIVTPTRELAEQIQGVVKVLGKHCPFRSATVYGGVGMHPQAEALRRGYEIIVACPGRLLDHVAQGNTRLHKVETLVLDEADRMLDMGFLPAVQKIIRLLPAERQTMLFSATFDAAMERLIASSLRSPERFSVDAEAPADTVAHTIYPVAQNMKNSLLLQLIKKTVARSILVFTRTKHRADRVVDVIKRAGHHAAALHANKSQSQRQHALAQFRSGRLSILVATDIAARGLDIASISHVINYDMPDSATTYIHRIGRTGRASRTGDALTLATWEDADVVRNIEQILGAPIRREELAGITDNTVLPVKTGKPVRRMTMSNRCTVPVCRSISAF
ncbi:DEAD/DEAH box helicase [candidate division FCPU426 bacterium]|nr:DEAD/DEAH box helicase [candidate division FCPU426 bacterium]